MTLAKIKSANALSGEMPLKSDRLAGLLCTRRQTESNVKQDYISVTHKLLSLTLKKQLYFSLSLVIIAGLQWFACYDW